MRLLELMSTIWSIYISKLILESNHQPHMHGHKSKNHYQWFYPCHKNRPKFITWTMVFWTC
jgi:hypothetical protein